MEIAREDLILVVEETVVVGFVVKERMYEFFIGNSVLFEINGPIEWTAFLISGDREKQYLIHNQKDNYMYEHQKMDKNNFVSLIQSALKDCDIDLIWNIVQCVINNAEHGAMIIFADNAGAEAERLKYSSFKITLMTLGADVVKHITSIDGAILFEADLMILHHSQSSMEEHLKQYGTVMESQSLAPATKAISRRILKFFISN